jgi:phenylpropionate dioxygenase-like ring-hydroxylating dioxygenase large terminal subunit
MFDGFANVWTPVTQAQQVGRKPRRIIVAGVPIVLFRERADRFGALIDRCPHRGVALSLGRVTDEGRLECPFHGWQFDADGANRHVPLNPRARLETLCATALPVRVIGDLVWIYTAPCADPPEPVAPEALADPRMVRSYVTRTWRCHWTRAMENMLDSPHLPFVHKRSIGAGLKRRMQPTSTMEITWEATDFGGTARASLDGRDGGGVLEFHRPNMMTLSIPTRSRRLSIHALVLPVDNETTQLTVCGSRNFLRSRLLNPLFSALNARIADEDRAIVESCGVAEAPPASAEHSVGSDLATLQFRRYYYETLRGSAA